jgi:ferritin-like metal-binding protein YciE
MEKITNLQELLKHELKDLYSAEVQLIDAIPEMAKKACNPELKKAFTGHLKVTQEHKKRLEQVQDFLNMEKAKETKGFFANLFKSKEGEEHCKAMEGLIKEAKTMMGENMPPEVMDAALIAAAQKIEHYEISSYGTARAYARQMGFTKVIGLLTSTLDEEYAADDSLTTLAVGKLNTRAEGKKNTPSPNKIASRKTLVKKVAKPAPATKTARKRTGKKITG